MTGVNTLNPNTALFNLSNAITTTQNFKVLMHNQYLNPAVKINIGNTNYLPNVDFGYISVKNFITSPTLALATLPTYNRSQASAGDGFSAPKYIGSLVLNMPTGALSAANWWGNGDIRAGLIPIYWQCATQSSGTNDGNMYKPIRAPANDATLGYPLDGPGTAGWSAATTPATATGVRHGGALTLQIIRDTTPDSAIELNDHLGRPEYGWRVKSANFAAYVLAEYTIYWHHPSNPGSTSCFNAAGWSKAPGPDNASGVPNPVPGATDPKIGNLGGSGTNITSVNTSGNTTTIVYVDSSQDVIQTIANANGTVTIVTAHFAGGIGGSIASVVNANGTVTSTHTHANGSVEVATAAAGASITFSDGVTASNSTHANTSGASSFGGLLNQNAIGYKRISWKELFR